MPDGSGPEPPIFYVGDDEVGVAAYAALWGREADGAPNLRGDGHLMAALENNIDYPELLDATADAVSRSIEGLRSKPLTTDDEDDIEDLTRLRLYLLARAEWLRS